jgi:hypothetical protein
MAAGIFEHHFLMWLDDQKPRADDKHGEHHNDGNNQRLRSPARTTTRIEQVSGIHGLSLSID